MLKLVECVALSVVCVIVVSSKGLHEEFTWTRLTYRWPKDYKHQNHGQFLPSNGNPDRIVFEGQTNAATAGKRPSGEIVPSYIDYRFENNIPVGANVWRNKLFITVPRRQPGIPSTLNYVPLDSKVKHNAPLISYPNWKLNLYPPDGNITDNFVSLYRIAIDPCDRLWAIDTGILESRGNATRVKPTTIFAIDLNTDRIMHKYQIPEAHLRPKPGQISITVDVTKNTCDDAYIYLPDISANELTVYSMKLRKSWRFSHPYFSPVSEAAKLSVAGYNFQWNDGIFSVELTDIKPNGFRDLYFHAMASTYVYKVSTKILKNERLATGSNYEEKFEVIGDRGDKFQTSTADIHKSSGTMFLALVNQNAVGCWNIKNPLNTISIVHKDDQKMLYPSDVKVSNNRIYVLTNSMPIFVYGTLDYDEINFRVWSNKVDTAIKGTNCI